MEGSHKLHALGFNYFARVARGTQGNTYLGLSVYYKRIWKRIRQNIQMEAMCLPRYVGRELDLPGPLQVSYSP